MASVNYTNITTPGDFMRAVNTATADSFWVVTLYMIFVVMLGTMTAKFGFLRALISASVMTIFLGLPLVFLNVINMIWLAPAVGFILFAILYTAYENRG